MKRVLPPARSLPLFAARRTREIEHEASAALPPHALMRRAGLAVARLSLALVPHARRIWVCAGPGNNGGDGFDAAIHLAAAGKDVTIGFVSDASKLPDDARDAHARATASGLKIVNETSPSFTPDLALDGLLGVGASRAPETAMAQAIRHLNALPCPVLAIDLPSGLHSGTGQALGADVVRASHTLALLTLKPGLFTAQGRDQCGDIWFDDLGVDVKLQAPDAWLAGPQTGQLAPRRHAQHKGSFGDVAIVAGAPGMTGAALLAARAAIGLGAGRVYVSLLDAQGPALDQLRPELMFRPQWWRSADEVLHQATVVCGCGGGDAVREVLPRLLSAAGQLVLDADALNAIAADTTLQTLLQARAGRRRPTILTPHPLEAARLLSTSTAQVQSDRLGAAQLLADRMACVVVLKGSGTVIAAPAVAPRINPTGSAALATPGTGDVLAGALGGTWAQAPDLPTLEMAGAVVYRHGAAADASTRAVVQAGELIEAMRAQP